MFKIHRVFRQPIPGRSGSLRNVLAEVDGAPFEFSSFDGGPWEVYDHPRSYRGVPRFAGYLPASTAAKLEALSSKFVSDRTVTTPEFYSVGEPMSRKPRRSRAKHSR